MASEISKRSAVKRPLTKHKASDKWKVFGDKVRCKGRINLNLDDIDAMEKKLKAQIKED